MFMLSLEREKELRDVLKRMDNLLIRECYMHIKRKILLKVIK